MKDRKLLMPLRDTVLGACLLLCLSVSVSCSRSEKPKAVEKKARTIEIAPTPLPVTGMVQIVRQIDTNSPHYRAPQNSISTPESQKAVRERQRAFAGKVISNELARAQVNQEDAQQELGKVGEEVQEKDPVVRDARAELVAVQQEYDAVCLKAVPGYADQVKEAGMLHDELRNLVNMKNKGETVDAARLKELLRRVNEMQCGINKTINDANATVPDVAVMLQKIKAAQEFFEQVLAKNDQFKRAKENADKVDEEIARLDVLRVTYEQEK
jgi:hypothetical protein